MFAPLPALTVVLATLLVTVLAVGQVGDVNRVHDPSIAREGNTFYVYSTGRNALVHTSTDLFTWHAVPAALPGLAPWTRQYSPPGNAPWAPDVSRCNGRWCMYYAVSQFGRRHSAIGLATNVTLDPTRPDYRWEDRGRVVGTEDADRWNAIDPCAVTDAAGRRWLVCGSCWSGIKLFELDPATGLLLRPDAKPIAIAAHPPDNIIEEGYIRRHGDAYFLWVSVGHCCRGVRSDYRITVGRSTDIAGPYKDRDGKPMLDGGGTEVLASDGPVRGPGSCAITDAVGGEYLIHHFYDGEHRGRPTLAVRQLVWDADGWPLAGEPITRPPGTPAPVEPVVGEWTVTTDFAHPTPLTLVPGGPWAVDGSTLVLHGPREVRCALADDHAWFVGRDAQGRQVRGVRPAPPTTRP